MSIPTFDTFVSIFKHLNVNISLLAVLKGVLMVPISHKRNHLLIPIKFIPKRT